jgi:hypothetical protein
VSLSHGCAPQLFGEPQTVAKPPKKRPVYVK